MKQSAKRLISSVLALFFVVGAFVTFFNFVQPAYQDVLATKVKLETLSAQLAAQKDVAQRLQRLKDAYESSGDARLQASLALPLSPQMSEALAQLNGLGQIHSLAPQAYNVSAQFIGETTETERRHAVATGASLVKPTGAISFNVRLFGSYEDFKRFLANLETNVRVFDVKSLNFQPATIGRVDSYTVELKVVAYYQQEQ